MSKFEKFLKLIDTVGNQWPLLIVIAVLLIIIIKWKTIWNGFGQINKLRLKKGDSEFELSAFKKDIVESKSEFIQKGKVTEDIEVTEENIEVPNTLFDTYWKLQEGKIAESRQIFEELQKKTNEPEKTDNM